MEILEHVQAVLCAEGITCENRDGELSTFIGTGLLGSRLNVSVVEEFLKVVVLIPLFAPIYRRGEMAEAVCRANFALKWGRFDLDYSDGQVVFCASLPIVGSEPSHEQLRCLVLFSWSIVARYTMAFAEVATSAAEPAMAIGRADASFREETPSK